jgi:hypothetical protein
MQECHALVAVVARFIGDRAAGRYRSEAYCAGPTQDMRGSRHERPAR